ncbi:MAG: aspartate aminotransferase family protein [Bacteroidetes bacterium]|nr:aspartate aminotransferase family protein [Bacteroidota bacterium]
MKLFDVYPLLPVTPVRASGTKVFCSDGKEYLDLYGGHAVISIGHSHPHYISKLTAQLNNIAFYSNAVQNPLQEELAENFGKISGYPDHSLFLCNSGAEANENALKLSSFHNGRKKIIAFTGSFHGRTSAAVAATHDLSLNSPVNLQHEIQFLPLNDHDAAKNIDETVCAVIIEGIQGVAGVKEVSAEFFQLLRKKCDETGAVLILDEVQSGCGRTGKYFAHQHSGIKADIISMAKGIGNGFPIGGILIAPHFKAKHGLLGTTFGGNYLACVSALAVIDVIKNESLMEHAKSVSDYLIGKIATLPAVKEVRGKGLMIGIELENSCAEVRKKLLNEHRIFTGSSSCKKTLRLLPPLTLTYEEADQFIHAFEKILIHETTIA